MPMPGPELTMLATDANSGGGGCDSVYLRKDGKIVVQAQEVDGATFGKFPNPLPGERGVCLDADIILRAADQLRGRTG